MSEQRKAMRPFARRERINWSDYKTKPGIHTVEAIFKKRLILLFTYGTTLLLIIGALMEAGLNGWAIWVIVLGWLPGVFLILWKFWPTRRPKCKNPISLWQPYLLSLNVIWHEGEIQNCRKCGEPLP